MSRRRPTVGLLVDTVSGEAQASVWPGIADTLQAQGVNLLCFVGGYLHDSHDLGHQGNIVFNLLDKNKFDGIIIWASALSSYIGREYIREFCDRYRPLPMTSLGVISPDIPSVVLDSYQGMREIMVHLIEHHGYRRLAFIRGPQRHYYADERYRAYVEVLAEYGIAFSADRVSPPYQWTEMGGRDAVRRWFSERRVDMDAVVAVSDNVAFDALQELHVHGVQVPDDVAVTGFDNTVLSRAFWPPLTTAPWRMYERGQQVAKLLLASMNGEPVPSQVSLPTHLIARQSCGCVDPLRLHAKAGLDMAPHQVTIRPLPQQLVETAWEEQQQSLSKEIEQILEMHTRSFKEVTPVLDALLLNLQDPEKDIFLTKLENALNEVAETGEDVNSWQDVISSLRRRISPLLNDDYERLSWVEDLWQQARVVVSTVGERAQAYQRWLETRQHDRLRRISHVLTTTTTTAHLMDLLSQELPLLGIRKCYLALYDSQDQPEKSCRLVLAFNEQGRIPIASEAEHLPSRRLASGGLFQAGEEYTMVVCPLYFQDEPLGFVMFERRLPGEIIDVLQDEISVTLKAVRLMEQNAKLYLQALDAQRESQAGQQRAEEANQLKSRFLSMVSHELLTPLVLLSGLSELMLRQTGNEPPLPEAYRRDLTRIHISAQQLGSLVRDVLDLARSQVGQLRLSARPVDLNGAFQAVVIVGEQLAGEKRLDWQVEIPDSLPLVMGDPVRLQQVTLNLIANAVKFTSRGQVALRVRISDQKIVVEVKDTGVGVPPEEQETIFDEFHQSKRTAARGYGGLGVGLAVCRQIIKLHGGQIGVVSSGELDSGSMFYYSIPILSARDAEPVGSPVRTQTVLLLTKRTDGSSRLHAYLAREGFQVETIDPDDDINWLPQIVATPPGALVLDYEPATERGWQLIEALKENPITREIPVLFYSLPEEQNIGAMLDLDYLTKPMGESALARVLRRYGLSGEHEEPQSILLVDDDPTILEMHRQLVTRLLPECHILEAPNGKVALDLIRREPPNLVLLDLRMPELDGMGVLAEMQSSENLRNIPVIILTAQILTEQDMAQLSQGVVSVLSKGLFSAEETFTQIERALAKNKNLGSDAQRLVRKAMAYVHEHYAEAISRDDVASFVGISARHLYRCFSDQLGMSPTTYLIRYRIQRSKELLQAGGRNITEIAQAVGFSSGSYFADVFRREVGESPRSYQKGERTVRS